MKYIVFDLEWNQSNTGLEREVETLPFEVIEIGAAKVNDNGVIIEEFSTLVKPRVYRELHHVTKGLIHIRMKDLMQGKAFPEAAESFLSWCGEEEYLFCTWGVPDLTELQRNMRFYEMTPLSDGPFPFLDVQKLFSIAFEDRKKRRSLEFAVDYLGIEKTIPFHRAFSDAYYTAKVLSVVMERAPEVLSNVSYDVFHPPLSRKREIKIQFDTYMKYISRVFEDKATALADPEVISTKCYLCRRNLRKKIRWFGMSPKNYCAVAYCEKHGYLKGKIRVRKLEDEKVYIVKTTKFITPEEMEAIASRREHVKEMRRRRK